MGFMPASSNMTRIFIKDPYIGHDTQSRRIFPGEYDIDDELLFGVGRSLVQTGYATVVERYEVPADLAMFSKEPEGTPATVISEEEAAKLPHAEVETTLVTEEVEVEDDATGDEPEDDATDDQPGDVEEVSLSDMKLAELRDFAAEQGIELGDAKTKADIAAVIHAAMEASLADLVDDEPEA